MNLSALLHTLQQTTEYRSLLARLQSSNHPTSDPTTPLNLLSAARPYLLAALQQDATHPILLVAPKPEHALQWYRQLSTWVSEPQRVLHFAEPDTLPYERNAMSLDVRQKRLATLLTLAAGDGRQTADSRASSDAHRPPSVVVTCARALMHQTLAPQHFRDAMHVIRRDESHPLNALLEHWQAMGYEPVEVVEARGQFSHRGGIVDVWSPATELPARIEFFGDEIDSIRQFDLVTQRSREPLSEVLIAPASEALPKYGPAAVERVRALLDSGQFSDASRRDVESDIEKLSDAKRFNDLEFYLSYLEGDDGCTLLDYFAREALVVSDDWQQVESAAREWAKEVEQLRRDAITHGEVPSTYAAPVIEWDTIAAHMRSHTRLNFAFGLIDETFGNWQELFNTAPRYAGKLLNAIDDWRERIGMPRDEKLIVVSRQAERIAELARERNLLVELSDSIRDENLTLMQGVLTDGFEFNPSSLPTSLPHGKKTALVLLSDAEIFGYARPEPRRSSEKRSTPVESFYADLQPGDYVVHIEHGIARYAGLVRRDFHAVEREYLQLAYAGGDKLYVPVDQADRVARFIGTADVPPTITRLGTADWETAKAKARRAVEDIANDLIALYAKRAQVKGHAFGSDSNWQQELEDSFPYAETPDQLRALDAIKYDMESARPMDRLVCGDVGYGKTEVALRAAFKAVMDGKQVAVLVPTTVLAEQHLKTFRERLQAFPVEVEMLSRFRTESQQKKILDKLTQGSVDIVIGTHRLLGEDVHFKELGLLVIDEEHRFGVKAKEKLKQLRAEVDVLTLTATPIPRTLNMALMGARDMSTIDTPPEERLPIRTYVTPYDEAVIRQATMRELARGGQVFFVHNRVQGIEHIMARIQRLVPDARVTRGHGQMRERELERVMTEFGERKYDVLVCTAIIESGIDLPNVNTIIINQADHFGLAELYQLRGRVGRSPRQAFAYLLYSREKVLSDVARKRLQAIFEASDLGAGFKIAMRDLEIRGAGDILGARQHGQIAAIGFDLYTKLLAQAVRERRQAVDSERQMSEVGGQTSEATEEARQLTAPPSVILDLPLEAHLPKDYVAGEEMRLRLYRRMAELDAPEAIDDFQQELTDRFGALPEPAMHLLYLLRLKVWAALVGVDSITTDDVLNRIVVRVRERVVLLEWRPSREVERAVTVGRNTITIPMDGQSAGTKEDQDHSANWMSVLGKAMQELATVAR